jgi:hemin uptake protein HemP
VGNDTRYHIALDSLGRLLSKTKLPNSELFRPETDIFITPEGALYFITGDRSGLRLFRGGVK